MSWMACFKCKKYGKWATTPKMVPFKCDHKKYYYDELLKLKGQTDNFEEWRRVKSEEERKLDGGEE